MDFDMESHHTSAQILDHNETETFSNRLSRVANRRRTPTPLVLSASSRSQQNMNPTSTELSCVSSPMSDATNRRSLPLRQCSIERQSNSAHHVKMGIRHSCPRTPLRLAGPGPASTPNHSRWQDSDTEYDTSFHSLAGLDYNQKTEELRPGSILHDAKTLSLDLSLDHIWPSPTSTVRTIASVESSANDSASKYSNDSDHSEGQPESPIAYAIPSDSVPIGRSSICQGISSDHDLHLLSHPCISPSAIEEDDSSLNSSSVALPINTKIPSAIDSTALGKAKPRAYSTITPSPLKDSTRTIQLRRSFGQLLLFRRPSEIQNSLSRQPISPPSRNNTSSEDEEKEELQIDAGDGRSRLRPDTLGKCRPSSESNLALKNHQSSVLFNDLELCSKSSDKSNVRDDATLNAHVINDQVPSRSRSDLGGRKGLMKLVKGRSSFGEKKLRSMSQTSAPLRHSESSHYLPRSSGLGESRPEVAIQQFDHLALNVTPNPRLAQDQESCQTVLKSQEKVEKIKPISTQISGRSTKLTANTAEPNPSSSLKIFKFWKRKKVESAIDVNIKKESTKIKIQKDTQKKDKVSSQIFGKKHSNPSRDSQSRSPPIPELKIVPSPSISSLKYGSEPNRSAVDLGKAQDISSSASSLGWVRHTKSHMGSPSGHEGYHFPTFEEVIPQGAIDNVDKLNLPKPVRPPRKIPITTRTI